MRVLLGLALAGALAGAGPARAWDPPARAVAALERGRPYVEVSSGEDGASGRIRAAIDIAAPPSAVFEAIADCELAPRMARTLKSCRVVQRDPQGRWDVREQVSKPALLPSIRSVFRSEFEPPRRIRFQRVSGDLARFEGEWRLQTLADGRATRVTYEALVSVPYRVPGALARMMLRMDVPAALLALRREAVARRDTATAP